MNEDRLLVSFMMPSHHISHNIYIVQVPHRPHHNDLYY